MSLFGMAVTAAELPVMSSATGTSEEIAVYLRGRLDQGLERIAFFIVPSAMAFFTLYAAPPEAVVDQIRNLEPIRSAEHIRL